MITWVYIWLQKFQRYVIENQKRWDDSHQGEPPLGLKSLGDRRYTKPYGGRFDGNEFIWQCVIQNRNITTKTYRVLTHSHMDGWSW